MSEIWFSVSSPKTASPSGAFVALLCWPSDPSSAIKTPVDSSGSDVFLTLRFASRSFFDFFFCETIGCALAIPSCSATKLSGSFVVLIGRSLTAGAISGDPIDEVFIAEDWSNDSGVSICRGVGVTRDCWTGILPQTRNLGTCTLGELPLVTTFQPSVVNCVAFSFLLDDVGPVGRSNILVFTTLSETGPRLGAGSGGRCDGVFS